MHTNCYIHIYLGFMRISQRLSTVKKKTFDKNIEKKDYKPFNRNFIVPLFLLYLQLYF